MAYPIGVVERGACAYTFVRGRRNCVKTWDNHVSCGEPTEHVPSAMALCWLGRPSPPTLPIAMLYTPICSLFSNACEPFVLRSVEQVGFEWNHLVRILSFLFKGIFILFASSQGRYLSTYGWLDVSKRAIGRGHPIVSPAHAPYSSTHRTAFHRRPRRSDRIHGSAILLLVVVDGTTVEAFIVRHRLLCSGHAKVSKEETPKMGGRVLDVHFEGVRRDGMASARQRKKLLQEEAERQRTNAVCLFEVVEVMGNASVDVLLTSLRVAGPQGELKFVHEQLTNQPSANQVLWRLPTHLMACSLAGEPGGNWQNEREQTLTERHVVKGVTCTQHLEKGLLLVRKLFVTAPYRPKIKQIMYRDEEWNGLLVDLIVHILLEFASPSMSVDTTVQVGRVDEACLEAKVVAGSLALISVAYHHETFGFNWEHTGSMLLRHPCSKMFVMAAFDATTGIVKAIAQLLQTQYKTMHLKELCVSAEIAMEPLGNLVAVLEFYEFLMKVSDPILMPSMRLIYEGIVGIEAACQRMGWDHNIPSPVHRVVDWSYLLFHTLSEYESPSFLDEMFAGRNGEDKRSSLLLATTEEAVRRCNLTLEIPRHQRLLNNQSFRFLVLDALRVVDILAEDSNCTHLVMEGSAPSLAYALSLPNDIFRGIWCGDEAFKLHHANKGGIQWEKIQPVSQQAKYNGNVLWNAVVPTIPDSLSKDAAKAYVLERTCTLLQSLFLFKIVSSLSHFNPALMDDRDKDKLLKLMCPIVRKEGVNFWKPKAVANLTALQQFVTQTMPQLVPEEDNRIFGQFLESILTFQWE